MIPNGSDYLNYENLLIESENQNLIVKEKDLPGYKGRIYKNRVAIRRNLSTTEKACVLAEELGHHYTTVGNILDQSKAENRKQERRARLWAYRKMFDLIDLVSAYKYGCRNRYEVAEYLGVTEQFLEDALHTYREKYGLYVKIDRYMICFDPLTVGEICE